MLLNYAPSERWLAYKLDKSVGDLDPLRWTRVKAN
jgi:hypothetical protein